MLTITPKLINTSATGTKVSVTVGISPTMAPSATGYGTFLLDLRWNTALASIDASSVKVIGNPSQADVTAFDAKGLASGILRLGGWSGTNNFSGGATVVTFEYTQTTLTPVNFVVAEERFDNVSYLSTQANSNVLQVALNAAGQSITPPVYETDPPLVSTYSPELSSKNAAVDANLVLTFNEAVAKGTGNIELRLGSPTGTLVESFNIATSSKLNLSGNVLTIDPTANLLNNSAYVVVLPAGVVRDLSGNALAANNSYGFSTVAAAPVDKTPPSFVSANTADNSAIVGLADLGMNLVATFSEPINANTGTISLRTGSATGTLVESFNVANSTKLSFSGSTVSIDPSVNLLQGKTYFVVFSAGAVKDLANNPLTTSASFSFTTAIAPVLVDAALNPTLVPVGDANKLNLTQLKSHLPSVTDASAVSQYKLLDSLVLKMDQNSSVSPTGVLSATKIVASSNTTTHGDITDKALSLNVSLPPAVNLDSTGPATTVSSTQSKTFFNNLLEQYFPAGQTSAALTAYKAVVSAALDTLATYAVTGTGTSSATTSSAAKAAATYATRLITPSGDSQGHTLQLAGSNTVNDFSVLNLFNFANDATVQVSNISNLVVAGPGNVNVAGSAASVLVGDTFNQTMVGGSGNDVLSGGGGYDVLYGGAGKDTFLLGAAGHVTLGDFAPGDVMKFNVSGVKSLADLVSHVVGTSVDSQGVTYALDNGLTITLIGKTLSSVYTTDMFAFGA